MENCEKYFIKLAEKGEIENLDAWIKALRRLRDAAEATQAAMAELHALDAAEPARPRESGIFTKNPSNRPEQYERSETRDRRLPSKLWYARDEKDRIWGFGTKAARDEYVYEHEGWEATERLRDPELEHALREKGYVDYVRLEDGRILRRAAL